MGVGALSEVMQLQGEETTLFELAGRAMLPGFVDSHGHVVLGGLQALAANLLAPPDGEVKDIASLQQTLRDWATANAEAVEAWEAPVGEALPGQDDKGPRFETEKAKLLQIVFVGQPELRDRIERPELRQLRQRITVRFHLGSINRQETAAYVQHRLLIAGSNGRPTFSRPAYRALHRYARGVPRLINAVCDKTLLCGYVLGRDHLGWWQVRRAIHDLEGQGW